ncbi:MAG TPA: nucleotidyltransferase domain-containing protein [Nitrospirae bacterium]|nr:nucleotidyltransferase domain-containing protein [Nitrospirota bacterium]
MYDKILSMKERILKVFEDFPEVLFAYLFGSVSEGISGPLSDLDIAIYMKPYSGERYIKLHTALCRILRRSDIDLLVLNRTRNLILIEEIFRKGQLIYDKEPGFRIEYEVKMIHRAIDFRTQRKAVMGI